MESYIHILSALVWAQNEVSIKTKGEPPPDEMWVMADAHHVTLRAGCVLIGARVGSAERVTTREKERILRAMRHLDAIQEGLQRAGVNTVVIKTLDHWPDFGTDIDLFTAEPEERVTELMRSRFAAEVAPPTLGDRLANKVNYHVPGLNELVEIHFGRLGQTGEHVEIAQRIVARQRQQRFDGVSLPVPAPEESVLLAALQRMYRHFYIRLCDIANTARIVESGVDYDDLRKVSKRAGIWPGVATYLNIVSEYVEHYRGRGLSLPYKVQRAARFGLEKVYPHAGFLRLPLFPQAASLYTRQLVRSVRRRDSAAALRLSLLPPLAAAAGAKYKVTGSDKGVW